MHGSLAYAVLKRVVNHSTTQRTLFSALNTPADVLSAVAYAPHAQVGEVAQKLIPDTSGVGHLVDLAGTPYSLSEDFVSSYRMHPLLPDTVQINGDAVCLIATKRSSRIHHVTCTAAAMYVCQCALSPVSAQIHVLHSVLAHAGDMLTTSETNH